MVEEDLRAEHIGEDELRRAEDRTVDVRLGREVDDRVDAVGRAGDRIGIRDVAVHELVLDPFEVRAVPGVGQLVEDDHLVAARSEAACEVRPDEAGAAGDEDPHRLRAYRVVVSTPEALPANGAAPVRLVRSAAPSTTAAAPSRRTRRW